VIKDTIEVNHKKDAHCSYRFAFIGLVAGYLLDNKFKPPFQHVTMKPTEPSQPYSL
jgi:hypothetical protein